MVWCARHVALIGTALLVLACGPSAEDGTAPDAGPSKVDPVVDGCLDNDADGVPGTGSCLEVALLDCDDADPGRAPGLAETCNGRDDDCDGQKDDGLTFRPLYVDADGDGFGAAGSGQSCGTVAPAGFAFDAGDCNDDDAAVNPGAAELCNGVDDDCAGGVDDSLLFQAFYPDDDGDGHGDGTRAGVQSCEAKLLGRAPSGGDCNDADPTVKPGATELCNKVDDDCDGTPDNGIVFVAYYADMDGDGYGAPGSPESACAPVPGKVTNAQDCDDMSPSRKPGAPELCNGVDDNCSGQADEGLTFTAYYPDMDGDGFGAATASAQSACLPVPGKVTNNKDCADADPQVKPGAPERCNGADDDCDGAADDGLTFATYHPDGDGDGFGQKGSSGTSWCAPLAGRVTNAQDCNDGLASVKPGATELCNGTDDDCDGVADDGLSFLSYYADADGDGHGQKNGPAVSACAPPAGRVTDATDCNDQSAQVHPGAAELCNAADDDCDGQTDEGVVNQAYYPDGDGDGFGQKGATPTQACAPVAGHVTNAQDCDDTKSMVRPGATELCNGADEDCDGVPDDGLTFLAYYPDGDGDGFGATGSVAVQACAPQPGRVTNTQDCDDARSLARPGGTEVCNGLDEDCDGSVDEGNPGGGAACTTGEQGVCSAGTRTCTGGGLLCVRNVSASAERCDGLDNDCNGQTDETFTDKGQACAVGQGVCRATGVHVCRGDGSGTQCGAPALLPTAPACDGQDNDCDGVTDEPALVSTADLSTVSWTDLELAPLYYSQASCAGGVVGNGTDQLLGAGLVMAGGRSGLVFQRLDAAGAAVDGPVTLASLTYTDVAIAQAQDGFVVAGIWPTGPELDFYFVDRAGARRVQLWSQFKAQSGNTLDSLRLVRGNGKRVTALWRESNVGIRLVQLEPLLDGTTWKLQKPGGGALTASLLVSGNVPAGLGADSSHVDWADTQSCVAASALRTLGVAYLPTPNEVRHFTVAENGTAKSAEASVRTEAAPKFLREPEVGFFQSGGDQWFVAYTTEDTSSTPDEDLNFWLTTDKTWHYAWLSYAKTNGSDSIRRPRVSATADRLWLSALRFVDDASGHTRQVMTRTLGLTGERLPSAAAVELPVTTGACAGEPSSCRPGDKDGFVSWARAGRVYYSAQGATPAGSFSSAQTCQ